MQIHILAIICLHPHPPFWNYC